MLFRPLCWLLKALYRTAPVLDEAVFLKNGKVFAHRSVEELRETEGMSVDAYFREVFKC